MLRLSLLLFNALNVILSLSDTEFQAISQIHRKMCPSLIQVDKCKAAMVNLTNQDEDNPIQDVAGHDGCCGYCDCHTFCFDYGSCCPHMYGSHVSAKQVMETNRFGCVRPQYILDGQKTKYASKGGAVSVWMITRCKPEISNLIDHSIRDLCMNPGQDGSLSSLTPVSDNTWNYRNRYCAICNGLDISSVSYWKLETRCSDFISHTDTNFLETVKNKQCNIFYIAPGSATTVNCSVPHYSISKCNETGNWTVYDKLTDLACQSFIDPFNLTYKNYFCYLCNTREQKPEHLWKCKKYEQISDVTPDFTVLIDLKDVDDKIFVPTCDVLTQFNDRKQILCRDIYCHGDRRLSGLQCLPNKSTVCYQMYVKLKPVGGTVTGEMLSNTSYLNYLTAVVSTFVVPMHTFVQELKLYKKASTTQEISYMVIEILLSIVSGEHGGSMADMMKYVHGKSFTFDNITLTSELAIFDKTEEEGNIQNFPHMDAESHDVLSHVFTKDLESLSSCDLAESSLYSKLTVCPYIELGLNDWYFNIKNDFLLIEETYTQRAFSRLEYEFKDNKIRICVEDFQSIYDALPALSTSYVNDDDIGPKRILAFVCICLSLICLLVTIVIHILYKSLHSQPCINNVILCVCLFLAQGLYQFGAGQRSLSDWECSIIGAFCHFFWLSVMFCMNCCSIQMYLIFKSSMKVSPKFRWKHTIKFMAYIVVASAVFVVINATVSAVKSGGEDSGYGGGVCYVSTVLMHFITFILPAAVTIVANIGLFCYVIFKLEKVNASLTKMNLEHNFFGIYARLSTLTGFTWLFGFILLFAKSTVLEYLFIIFNASQGVLIMVAFIINKRVISLCFGKEEPVTAATEVSVKTHKQTTVEDTNASKDDNLNIKKLKDNCVTEDQVTQSHKEQ